MLVIGLLAGCDTRLWLREFNNTALLCFLRLSQLHFLLFHHELEHFLANCTGLCVCPILAVPPLNGHSALAAVSYLLAPFVKPPRWLVV